MNMFDSRQSLVLHAAKARVFMQVVGRGADAAPETAKRSRKIPGAKGGYLRQNNWGPMGLVEYEQRRDVPISDIDSYDWH